MSFDNNATLSMGAAFDQACSSLGKLAHAEKVRELLAKRIIEAASHGEFDPVCLHAQALLGFSIDDVSMRLVGVREQRRFTDSSANATNVIGRTR